MYNVFVNLMSQNNNIAAFFCAWCPFSFIKHNLTTDIWYTEGQIHKNQEVLCDPTYEQQPLI